MVGRALVVPLYRVQEVQVGEEGYITGAPTIGNYSQLTETNLTLYTQHVQTRCIELPFGCRRCRLRSPPLRCHIRCCCPRSGSRSSSCPRSSRHLLPEHLQDRQQAPCLRRSPCRLLRRSSCRILCRSRCSSSRRPSCSSRSPCQELRSRSLLRCSRLHLRVLRKPPWLQHPHPLRRLCYFTIMTLSWQLSHLFLQCKLF